MEINIIQKLDEWYKEWRGVSHLEESNIHVLDSSDAQDFARYCIGEFKTLQASDEQSKLNLADVSKQRELLIAFADAINVCNGNNEKIGKLVDLYLKSN